MLKQNGSSLLPRGEEPVVLKTDRASLKHFLSGKTHCNVQPRPFSSCSAYHAIQQPQPGFALSYSLSRRLMLTSTALWMQFLDHRPCEAAAASSKASPPTALARSQAAVVVLDKGSDGSGRTFNSISEALEAAGHGARVQVTEGRYHERLNLNRAVTLEAFPEGANVEVVWETDEPYQHTVEINHQPESGSREGVVLKGLRIRHYSKSVADNYAVYISAGSPLIESCDISSRSGTGVGIEGALRPRLASCHIHGCERHGIAAFGSIEDGGFVDLPDAGLDDAVTAGASAGMTFPILERCEIDGNRLEGVLVRTGAGVSMGACSVHDNEGFGVSLQDAGGWLEGNTIAGNKKGEVFIRSNDLDLSVTPEKLRAFNSIKGRIIVI